MYLVGAICEMGVLVLVCVVTCEEGALKLIAVSKVAELTIGRRVSETEPVDDEQLDDEEEVTMLPKLYNPSCQSVPRSSTSDVA